jgi:outer membrane protein
MYNKKKIINYILIAAIVLLAATGAYFITKSTTSNKTGYIVIVDVYNKFNLKIELEKKFLIVQSARQKIMDSLVLQLQFLENKQKANPGDKALEQEYSNMRDDLIQKKQRFDEDNTSLTTQYDTEILTQLNQYIKDYGKEHKYQYIFGANGSGDVLYADESENLTEEVILYINDRYSGKEMAK